MSTLFFITVKRSWVTANPASLCMRRWGRLVALLASSVAWLQFAPAEELGLDESRWAYHLDMGGSIPQDTKLTRFGGPVSGEYLKLSPGVQLDMGWTIELRLGSPLVASWISSITTSTPSANSPITTHPCSRCR